ncbi:Uncharacterized protein FWK35_00032837 [Aphis craccivora]|uniref:Uncharacterized protein n=1 Tax=Aphis craccivora TaxID=307492 RepID=A0A6G0VQ95_APHCR|nr:Uncharacterized protein FWK35_00032837 [Aphis craccivora]
MKNDEDVLTYTGRVEQLYYNLCNATLANKTQEEARILRQTLKDQALAIYINGTEIKIIMEIKILTEIVGLITIREIIQTDKNVHRLCSFVLKVSTFVLLNFARYESFPFWGAGEMVAPPL